MYDIDIPPFSPGDTVRNLSCDSIPLGALVVVESVTPSPDFTADRWDVKPVGYHNGDTMCDWKGWMSKRFELVARADGKPVVIELDWGL